MSEYCKNCYKLAEENEKLKHQLQEALKENEELKSLCKKYGKISEQETKDYAELKNKECIYGGNSCYKSMLDIITDESEE